MVKFISDQVTFTMRVLNLAIWLNLALAYSVFNEEHTVSVLFCRQLLNKYSHVNWTKQRPFTTLAYQHEVSDSLTLSPY